MSRMRAVKRRLLTLLSALSLLLLVAAVVSGVRGCLTRDVPTVQYVLPDGYSGYFWVVHEDGSAGEGVIERDGLVVMTIPDNGILRVRDASVLHGWHRSVARYASGAPIATTLSERPIEPDELVVWGLGTSSEGVHTYLLGTRAERDAYYADDRQAARRLYVERLVKPTKAAP